MSEKIKELDQMPKLQWHFDTTNFNWDPNDTDPTISRNDAIAIANMRLRQWFRALAKGDNEAFVNIMLKYDYGV